MDAKIEQFIESLPDDLRAQAQAAHSREDILKVIDNYDGAVPLSEDELNALAAGCSDYGDERTDFDPSRMDERFLRGEDLGF